MFVNVLLFQNVIDERKQICTIAGGRQEWRPYTNHLDSFWFLYAYVIADLLTC